MVRILLLLAALVKNNLTKKSPLVSVGIPTYNQPEFLQQAIQSVLDQTFQDFEIIVFDDCSTDNTPDIVHGFNDPRILYFRSDINLRPPASWNECVRLARGRYFSLLPHDDLYDKNFLERMVCELENSQNAGFVQCAYRVIDSQGVVSEKRYVRKSFFSAVREEGLKIQLENLYCNPVSILFNKKILVETGRWETSYWDDMVLILRIAFDNGFIYLPECLSSLRTHPNNLSTILDSEGYDKLTNVINEQTALFGHLVPMSQELLKLRYNMNFKIGASCVFSSIKHLLSGQYKLSGEMMKKANWIYPNIFFDLKLYRLVINKLFNKNIES